MMALKLPADSVAAQQAALPPGSYEQMWNEVRRALLRFFPFDHEHVTVKGAMARVIQSAISEAWLGLSLTEPAIESTRKLAPTPGRDTFLWSELGEARGYKKMIHTIYYEMVAVGLIEVEVPEKIVQSAV